MSVRKMSQMPSRNASLNRFFLTIPVVVSLLSMFLSSAKADKNSDALKVIADTADRICGTVVAEGNSQSVEVKGNVKGQLNGLVKKLAELGISGDASI